MLSSQPIRTPDWKVQTPNICCWSSKACHITNSCRQIQQIFMGFIKKISIQRD